jgi:hypothetical protein
MDCTTPPKPASWTWNSLSSRTVPMPLTRRESLLLKLISGQLDVEDLDIDSGQLAEDKMQ